MRIWRLEPCDPLNPSWEASSHRGAVVIRAPSETVARETAERAFGVKTRFAPSKGMHAPPWRRPDLVHARIIESPSYPVEGPVEVLEPSFQRDLPRHERQQAKAPARRG
jgi:hypothetical protein